MYRIIIYNVLVYLFIFVYFVFYGYKEPIPLYMFVIQSLFLLFYSVNLYLSIKSNSIYTVLFLVFLYSVIFSLLIRYGFLVNTYKPFGDAVDSYNYDSWASNSIDKSFERYIDDILLLGYKNDDLGYPAILYIFYNIMGSSEAGRWIMLIVNAFFIMVSTNYLYGFMRLFSMDKKQARFFSAIWGFFPFLSVTSAVGLKENFFSAIIIASFYYMYMFKMNKSVKYLLIFIPLSLLSYYFRIVLIPMLILSFVSLMLVNKYNKKSILVFFLISVVVGVIFINLFISYFYSISLDFVLDMNSNRFSDTSGTIIFKWFVQMIAAIIGPFPNFNQMASYGMLHSSGLVLKVLLSYLLGVGVYLVIKNTLYEYYPLIIFLLMGGVMLVISGVALDMRYHITFFPIILPLVALSLKNKNILISKKYLSYIVLIIFIIIAYNGR